MTHAAELLLLIFLSVTFLQSGFDKVLDWKGNLAWLVDHFAKSPLKNTVPFLLGTITLIEVMAGLLSLGGIVELVVWGSSTLAFYGAVLSCIALLMLLFGQRLAKDYDGARTLVIYLIPAVFLVFLLQP